MGCASEWLRERWIINVQETDSFWSFFLASFKVTEDDTKCPPILSIQSFVVPSAESIMEKSKNRQIQHTLPNLKAKLQPIFKPGWTVVIGGLRLLDHFQIHLGPYELHATTT